VLMMTRRGLLAISASLAWAKDPTIRVGCQTNGFPLKQGDFPALIAALESLKRLGYTGFECNVRFVEGEFGRAVSARQQIEKTGVKFIGAHANMDQVRDKGAAMLAAVAALGADCIVMSGRGLSPTGEFTKDALVQKAKAIESLARTVQEHKLRL